MARCEAARAGGTGAAGDPRHHGFQLRTPGATAGKLGTLASDCGASGGFLGLGSKISPEEAAVMKRVASEIEQARAEAAKKVLGAMRA
jgi:hypothetical protein